MSSLNQGRRVVKMSSETAILAGKYLEQRFSGASTNKRIAQWAQISPEMAKLLRRGEGWTVARLDQAAKAFGDSFRLFVYQLRPAGPSTMPTPSDLIAELAHLRSELAQTREEIAHVASRLASIPLAQVESETTERAGKDVERLGLGTRAGSVPAGGGNAGAEDAP